MTNSEVVVRLISIKRNYVMSAETAQAVNLAIAFLQENAHLWDADDLRATLERHARSSD